MTMASPCCSCFVSSLLVIKFPITRDVNRNFKYRL